MSEEQATWRTLGAEPVSGEYPSGRDVRYEPEFEQLQSEIQKLESVSGDTIDWNQVVALSRDILRAKSKDLLVGCFLTVGLLNTEKYGGLSNGLACLEGIISGHWPTLYPAAKRMRARISALNWLSEKTASFLSRMETGPDAADTLRTCQAQVKALEDLLNEKIGPEEPVLTDLFRTIREQLNRLPTAAVDSGGGSAAPERASGVPPSPAVASPAKEPPATIETPEDARRRLKDAFASLKKIASFTRSQDPAQSLPYRVTRFLTWCEIETPPPAENGRSRIPSPPKQLRDRLQSLRDQSSWKELVSQAEAKVSEFPFWLDLHRICDMSLAQLGPNYAMARKAVKSETAKLLDRIPELIELKFSDGTPFADEATRSWISTQLFPEKEDQSTETAIPEQEIEFLAEAKAKSRSLLQEGNPKAALSLIHEAVRSASTERRKFLARLELANLCLETGYAKVALVHLKLLDEQVARHSLDMWEPQLALQVLHTYYRTLNKILRETKHPEPEISHLADSVYGRLCTLDILAGLNAINA